MTHLSPSPVHRGSSFPLNFKLMHSRVHSIERQLYVWKIRMYLNVTLLIISRLFFPSIVVSFDFFDDEQTDML